MSQNESSNDMCEERESLEPQEGEYQIKVQDIKDCDAFEDIPDDVPVLV